ncbi:MAG: ATP-dependent protease, partial [Gammaproteobacteria bacterium]
MGTVKPLSINSLYTRCDPQQFLFADTSELQDGDVLLGQQRAVEAFEFALQVDSEGYNIYAMGIPQASRVNLVSNLLENHASEGLRPPDWCYIYNFDHPSRPSALSLPAGHGREFQQDITQLLDDLRTMIPATFDSEEYKSRRQFVEQQIHERQNDAIENLREKAREQGVTLMPTPSGFAFAPIKNDETVTPEIFKSLPDDEKQQIETTIKNLQKELHQALSKFPAWQKESMEKIRELNNEVILNITESLVSALQEKYQVFIEVVEYLEKFEQDIARQGARALMETEEEDPQSSDHKLSRYKVNLLVEQTNDIGVPIVFEDNPVLTNLVGQVEHQSQMGTLHTDLTLIKPGALHYANGGYLVLEIEKLLTKPFSWEGLKRSLSAREIRIDPLERAIGWMSTAGLEPEPIPLNIKVVLVGDPRLYYLLTQYDPEFSVFFKVVADFDDQVERTIENNQTFARLIADIAANETLLPCDPTGVGRLIEYSSRIAADAERMSVDRDAIRDLLVEASLNAKTNDQQIITAESVSQAWASRVYRNDRIRERMQEQILRETLLVDTSGEQVGQINGLAVYTLGQFYFGKPTRITARVHVGRAGVLDIERKVELGGPTHSKGI